MICDPSTISKLSSCVHCLTNGQLMQVKTYLLCKWAQTPKKNGLFSPIAFFNGAELDWMVGGPQPTDAVIEFSPDNTVFNVYAPYAPSVPWMSTADVFDNGYYRVIGKTGGVAITNYSNVVSFGV